jgi:hypothetical protein
MTFRNILTYLVSYRAILTIVFLIGLSANGNCQSPKKLLANGYYEQAFVNAVYKQNKKVKLKEKFTEVIYPSYEKIYTKNSEIIKSSETTWQQSYNALILTSKYRAKVKHPGVSDNLANILYDKTILDQMGSKFNNANRKDMEIGATFKDQGKFEKALELYRGVAKRHREVEPITTLTNRLLIIDHELLIENANQKYGDQYIAEATEILGVASAKSAEKAISLIEKARALRPLNLEEEALLELAHLFKSNSIMQDAEKLLLTPTKKNARLAFELIERVRNMRTLSAEEERLSEKANEWGMTKILVNIDGDPVNTKESLSGFLNKSKTSKWITYYFSEEESASLDFKMTITENQPIVLLGKRKKEVSQQSKTVEYYEEETDGQGNTIKVKKTRQAIAMVAVLSRTKTASLAWSIVLKDLSDGKAVFSENTESIHEIKNEFASLESGDILALPENIETDIDLDSQPFPSDKDMVKQVKQQYLHELNKSINNGNFHLINVNKEIKQ